MHAYSNSNIITATTTVAIPTTPTSPPTWPRVSYFSKTIRANVPKLHRPSTITPIDNSQSRRVLSFAIEESKNEAPSIYASFCLLRQI